MQGSVYFGNATHTELGNCSSLARTYCILLLQFSLKILKLHTLVSHHTSGINCAKTVSSGAFMCINIGNLILSNV